MARVRTYLVVQFIHLLLFRQHSQKTSWGSWHLGEEVEAENRSISSSEDARHLGEEVGLEEVGPNGEDYGKGNRKNKDTCIWSHLRQVKGASCCEWRDPSLSCNIGKMGKQVVTAIGSDPSSARSFGYVKRITAGPPFKWDLFECTCSEKLPETSTTEQTSKTSSIQNAGLNYTLVSSGSNCTRVRSLSECSSAAIALGLLKNTAVDDKQSRKRFDPPYCYVEKGVLKFNSDGSNTGKCSARDQCVCRIGQGDSTGGDDQYEVYEAATMEGNFENQPERHDCDRVCKKGEPRKICWYRFDVAAHTTMGKACYTCSGKNDTTTKDCFRPHCVTGDGFEKGIIGVNRTMPGPTVVACVGDHVVVNVHNNLPSMTTSLHFHGEQRRNGWQYYDGVPYVTQCPIYPHQSFRYQWPATIAGSYWYTSFTALQRMDGFVGRYIVRQTPEEEPHSKLYDYDLTEHYMLIQEIYHRPQREEFVIGQWNSGIMIAENLLVNGRGRLFLDEFRTNPRYNKSGHLTTNKFEEEYKRKLPMATFFVTKGQKYRFRVAYYGFGMCPVMVNIQEHDMLIIASDTSAVKPKKVKSFIIHSGERFDFVLDANHDSKPRKTVDGDTLFDPMEGRDEKKYKHNNGVFKIFYQGLLGCEYSYVVSEGLLVYSKSNTDRAVAEVELAQLFLETQKYPDETNRYTLYMEEYWDFLLPQLQPLQYAKGWPKKKIYKDYIPITDLKRCKGKDCKARPDESQFGSYKDPALKKVKPDKTFYLAFDSYSVKNPHYHHNKFYPIDRMAVISKDAKTVQFNHISLKLNTAPLLTKDSHDNETCNEKSLNKRENDCERQLCECPYVIKVNKGDVVEMFLIDEGYHNMEDGSKGVDMQHPIHVHGYSFYVIAMERHGRQVDNVHFIYNVPADEQKALGNTIKVETVKELNKAGNITRNLKDPPLKDTVIVPDAGFTLIRFLADNPGYWLIHDMLTWHQHMGMGVVLQVGERSDIEKDIPDGFPTCDDFLYP